MIGYLLFIWSFSFIPLIFLEISFLFGENPSLYGLDEIFLSIICLSLLVPFLYFLYRKENNPRPKGLNKIRKKIFLITEKRIKGEKSVDWTDNNETNIWYGKKSAKVIENAIVRYFVGLWTISFTALFIVTAINWEYGLVGTGIHTLIFIIFLALCHLPLLSIGVLRIKTTKKVIYKITDRRILRKLENQHKEILLSAIDRFEIKKRTIDIPQLNTGTISFYEIPHEKPRLKFEHIEKVDQVAEILQKLTS